MAVVESSILL